MALYKSVYYYCILYSLQLKAINGLRSRDHNFQLPVCNNFSRKPFIIRHLFRFKYILLSLCVFLIASFLFFTHVLVFILPFLPLLGAYITAFKS